MSGQLFEVTALACAEESAAFLYIALNVTVCVTCVSEIMVSFMK
jgi:hypothetical protein